MPIKPENKARYPQNWKEIREQRLIIAGHRCENCGVHNYAIGYRTEIGEFVMISRTGKPQEFQGHATGYKVLMIVLTIAHLDHIPENCSMDNLRAWCQRCHLAYDHHHHQANARETRRKRIGVQDLFSSEALA